jgi:hypothetical protein
VRVPPINNMRNSVLLFCGLIFAACLGLIYRSSFRPGSSGHPAPEANPPVQRSDPLLGDSEPAAPREPQVPEWETRFWKIASEPAWLQSQEELEELVGSMTDDQIRDALDKLGTDQSGAGIIFGRLLVRRWAEKSPAEAAQWVAGLPDNSFGHAAFKEVVIPWAEKDLDGAVGWVQQLPEGGNKTAAELSLAAAAANQQDAVTAINLTASLPPSPERDSVLNYSVRQWATTDKDSAVAWINQVEDPALREKMLGEVAVNMGAQDPVAAAEFVATAMPDGQDRNNATVEIIRFWASSAPADAASWVEQFPEGQLRNAAMENLIDVWGKDDLSQAGAWLDGLPAGSSRDKALNSYATFLDGSSAKDDNH